MFKIENLFKIAAGNQKTIVLPEGECERVLNATQTILKKKICQIILLGNPQKIKEKGFKIGGATIIEPSKSDLSAELSTALYELRKEKGLTQQQATELVCGNNFYFAAMLVKNGYADGYLGGVETSTADCLRPALQIIKCKKDVSIVSSCVMFVGTDKLGFGQNNVLFTADCSLNINPTAQELCQIALTTAKTAQRLANITPRVALLSFSTLGSGGNKDESILKVKQALEFTKAKDSKLIIDGEMQLDCALISTVAKLKAPSSPVGGKANVLIFPELNSANIGYKLIERFGKLQAIGQIMQGFNSPVNDMSRGCSVADIVVMSAITAIQAQNNEK